MRIYTFWSGDTTYFTTSKSLRKAQVVGRDIQALYLDTCAYLGDVPEAGDDYFIPTEVDEVTVEWFRWSMKNDKDTLILDDKLYSLI